MYLTFEKILLILIMKGIGLVRCFVFMLISLSNVYARPWSETTHNSEGQTGKSISNIRFFEEIGVLSQEPCHILPSDLKSKCSEMNEAYVHRTTSALKALLHEEILCNLTGLCIKKTFQVTDERSCTVCRRAVKDLFYQLNQSKIRMRIMDALLEYCEEAEDHEEQCKDTVYKYAPLVLNKLDKLKPNDICRVIGLCDEGVSI